MAYEDEEVPAFVKKWSIEVIRIKRHTRHDDAFAWVCLSNLAVVVVIVVVVVLIVVVVVMMVVVIAVVILVGHCCARVSIWRL